MNLKLLLSDQWVIFKRGLPIVAKRIAAVLLLGALAVGFALLVSAFPGAALIFLGLAGLFVWIMVSGEAAISEDFYRHLARGENDSE